MIKIWTWLAGKKTYIMAGVIGVDASGVQLGWWAEGSFRHVIEGLTTLLAIRSAIDASGPVLPTPPPVK